MEVEDTGGNHFCLEALPMEIIIHICNFLEPDFILSVLSRVNKKFERIATDQALWRIRIARRWPASYPPVEPDQSFSWSEACRARENFVRHFSNVDEMLDSVSVKAHYSSVDTVLFVDDGNLLMSGSRDRSIALWRTSEMVNGQPQAGLVQKDTTVHKGWVWSLNYNKAKSQVVSSGWDYHIHLWDLGNDGLRHASSINCKTALLCADLNSDHLVTVGTFDKKIKTFDLRMNNNNETAAVEGNAVEDFKCHRLPVLSVATNPNDSSQLISASEDGSVVLFDRRNRKVIKRLHFTKGTFPMCVKTFGGAIYVGDKMGNLHLVDLSPKNPLRRMKTVSGLHDGKLNGIDTSLGGIVTCSSDGKVKVIHPDMSCSVINAINCKDFGEATSISYSNGLLASGHSLETVRLWRPKVVANEGSE